MISVCLASYNGSKYIETQIRSILSQLSENDELIISDDGSTDNTISVINSINDRRILFIHNKGTHGYTGNFENALKHAKGDIIVLSDQDDVWVDNKISIICRDLDTADFVTSNAIVVDGDLNIINESLWSMRPPGFSPLADFVQCAYLGCCMAFNRKVLDFALPFPPNHNLCAHDYWLQLVGSFFFKVKYEHTPLIYYRRHGSNVSDAGFSKGLPIYDKIKYRLYTIIWLFLRKYGKK